MEAKVYLYAWEDKYSVGNVHTSVVPHSGMEAQGWILLDTQIVTFNEPPMAEIEAQFAATQADRDAKRIAELKKELLALTEAKTETRG